MLSKQLLDHGLIRLVDSMGSDLSVVRNARVSYDAAWRTGENEGSDIKLINYLMKNGHNTPFEGVTVTFEVKAPIFVFRQWHRHRTQSYNELSARYKELPEEFYVPEPELIGTQSSDNKQMRDMSNPVSDKDDFITRLISEQNKSSFLVYRELIELGTPREIARSVLPMGTYSHMFATASLHNWLKFVSERSHEHAQYEIQVYSDAILDMLYTIAPVSVEAFKTHVMENK